MDILRNLFGALSSGVIRLLVSVGILAAAYFFIVKPVLKTTSDAIKTTNHSFEKSFGENGLGDLQKTFDDVNRQVERQIQRSFHTAKREGNPRRLVRCIKHSHGDVQRIQRCTVKF
jgi:predicted PurR-regulated permease PerM